MLNSMAYQLLLTLMVDPLDLHIFIYHDKLMFKLSLLSICLNK